MMIHSILQAAGSVNATATIAPTVLQGCYVIHGTVRATLRGKEVVKPALCITVLVYERYECYGIYIELCSLTAFPDVS